MAVETVVPPVAQGTPTPLAEPVKQAVPAAVAPTPAPAVPPKPEAVPPKAEEKPNSLLSDPADPAKPKETPPAVAVKADLSKLKLPEGSLLKADAVEAVKALAEKQGMTAEAAQAMIDDRSLATKAYHEGLVSEHKAAVAGWRKTIESHPVFGGPNLKATDEAISAVVSRFGPKGLMETIQQAGYNWHPGFLEFLHNVASATKDAKFVQGGPKVSTVKYGNLESMY